MRNLCFVFVYNKKNAQRGHLKSTTGESGWVSKVVRLGLSGFFCFVLSFLVFSGNKSLAKQCFLTCSDKELVESFFLYFFR